MKKMLTILCLGLIIYWGIYYRYNENSYAYTGNVSGIQLGVFTKSENANNLSNRYGGIVIEDNGYYRVYYSILRDTKNINYIKSYLDNKHVSYYERKVTIPDEYILKAYDYEKKMVKSKENDKDVLNRVILEIYGGVR